MESWNHEEFPPRTSHGGQSEGKENERGYPGGPRLINARVSMLTRMREKKKKRRRRRRKKKEKKIIG